MTLNLKAKLVTVAVTALVGSPAFAALFDTTTGNASLVLGVYESGTKSTFAFDTGLRYNDIIGNPTNNLSFDLSSNANWANFYSAATGTGATGPIQYAVYAANNVVGNQRLLTTAAAGTTNQTGGNSQNGSFFSATGNSQTWLNSINAFIGSGTSAFVQEGVAGATSLSNFGTQVLTFGGSFSGNIKFNIWGVVDNALSFYELTKGTPVNNNLTRIKVNGVGINTENPAGAAATGQWLLASNGQLSYTAVAAPVPEPETYAMLLAGLGVVGFIARRRQA